MAKAGNRADSQPAGGKNAQGQLLFGSDKLSERQVRQRVRAALHCRQEPEPKYRDGKSWRD